MKLSDYVINFLADKKVSHVFEVCGGAITHLLDSLHGRQDVQTVSMHHEQAAAFAAEGYARITGNIGVALATSGPGATNLITGIGSCFFDSIPCFFITGQVNTYEFKFHKPVRQIGFQETDIVPMVKPVVKEAVLLTEAGKIRFFLEKLSALAISGRPGPVLLDLPMDIQRADVEPEFLESFQGSVNSIKDFSEKIKPEIIEEIVKLLSSAQRPVIIAGGGVRLAKANEELLKFTDLTEIPVVASLMGLDALPHEHPSFVGLFGTYGNRYANLTLANSDLVIVLGSRLDTRQTGTRPETFARGAKIIHVDIDPHELNNKIQVHYSINRDLKLFLTGLTGRINKFDKNKIKSWRQTIADWQQRYPSYQKELSKSIDPNYFIHQLSQFIPEGAVICEDIGQNQMWAAQSLKIKKSQRFITQGGMGAMGSSLPMAIGASFARSGRTMVVITGDGGFQLNIQELQTVYHHKLPIKIILLNNHCYGMVRQFQEQYFNSRFQSTVIGYSCPDFQKVVAAYNIPVAQITRPEEIIDSLEKIFSDDRPCFLEVNLCSETQVIPKLGMNRPIEEQEPRLSAEELKSQMFIDVWPEEKIK